MSYAVKEIYYTLQGEGANTGRPAVFLRFAGCNLWSGREQDRSSAICQFCDTDFIGGTKFTNAEQLAEDVASQWFGNGTAKRFVVVTGGEPLLQLDRALVEALHGEGFRVAIETNGTLAAPSGIDWICVSPKSAAALALRSGDELKLVYPQAGARPERFESLAFEHFFLQPMDGPQREAHTREAIAYCLEHPRWRLSLQSHKIVGIR